MRILWTDEALDDLEEILAYYYLEASPRTAVAVERRIIGEIESLRPLHCIILRTSAEVQESLQVVATQGLFLSLTFCRSPLRSAYSRDF